MIYFCEMLYRIQGEICVQWKRDEHWGNELRIQDQKVTLDLVISCLVKVLMFYRLNKMIKQITREKYFYTDKEEIERICLLTNWIVTEKHYQEQLFNEHFSLEKYLFNTLRQNIEDAFPIHFDSLITFCTQPLQKKLKEAVGYGIDEMKREEEHQSFVQSIRDFIKRRKSKSNELHIVQGENFTFYKPTGEQYSYLELKTLMYNEPLYILGLDANEMNLSPIITLLPKKIYIYGDHPAEAKTSTILNIFQERVTFLPKESFPFHYHVN